MGVIVLPPLFELVIGKRKYTETFVPAPTHNLGSTDTYLQRYIDNGTTWAGIHDNVANFIDDTAVGLYVTIRSYTTTNYYRNMVRSILTFPTNSIPVNATIIEATLGFYLRSKEQGWAVDPTVNVFESYPTDKEWVLEPDYLHIYNTPLSTPKAWSQMSVLSWQTFSLNATGLTKIAKNDITCLALREASYDAPNSPPPWESNKQMNLNIDSADSTPNKPYLTVTYEV